MKKLLFALVLGLLLVAALATVASADAGPHGGFTNTTDACASCHRAHTARSSNGMLLVASDIWDLCVSCHDGTGAYTNVVDGYYDTTIDTPDPEGKATSHVGANNVIMGEANMGLFGGGFINARMAHTWNGRFDYGANVGQQAEVAGSDFHVAAAGVRTTSRHEVEGIDNAGVAGIVYTAGPTVWGSGDISITDNTGSAISKEMECTSCHDPHGSAGRNGGTSAGMPRASYRLLRFNPNGSNGFEITIAPRNTQFTGQSAAADLTGDGGVHVADVATKWYTPNTNATADPTVAAMRSRWDGTAGTQEPYHGYINSLGDYAGRTYNYRFPAVKIEGTWSGTGTYPGTTYWSCEDTSGFPTGPGTAISTATATAGLSNAFSATLNLTLCGQSTNPITGAVMTQNATAGSAWNNTSVLPAMSMWCSTCHDRYMNTQRTATTTDSLYHEAHNTASSTVACVACHVAHGTTATMTTDLARNATFATGSSVLLKTDNRSICADCHGTTVNFWNYDNQATYGTLTTPNATP